MAKVNLEVIGIFLWGGGVFLWRALWYYIFTGGGWCYESLSGIETGIETGIEIEAIAMPESSHVNDPPPPPPPADSQSPSAMNFQQWIESLRSSDRLFYNMIAVEVWSIAKTMDHLFPGFWGRFMANRRLALKQFIQHRQAQRTTAKHQEPD